MKLITKCGDAPFSKISQNLDSAKFIFKLQYLFTGIYFLVNYNISVFSTDL